MGLTAADRATAPTGSDSHTKDGKSLLFPPLRRGGQGGSRCRRQLPPSFSPPYEGGARGGSRCRRQLPPSFSPLRRGGQGGFPLPTPAPTLFFPLTKGGPGGVPAADASSHPLFPPLTKGGPGGVPAADASSHPLFPPLTKGGPGGVPAADASSHLSARSRISLCMIVKNEEATLGACLASVADLVDEMVVVDTGSTDRTREIALEYGARVIDFAWTDDFAAAPTRASSTPRAIGSSGSTPMSSSTRRTARN